MKIQNSKFEKILNDLLSEKGVRWNRCKICNEGSSNLVVFFKKYYIGDFLQSIQKIKFDKSSEEEFIYFFKLTYDGYGEPSKHYEYEIKTNCDVCSHIQLFDVTADIQNLIETKDDLFIQS